MPTDASPRCFSASRMHVRQRPRAGWTRKHGEAWNKSKSKRVLEVVLVVLASLMFSPLLLVIAIAIKACTPSYPIFGQVTVLGQRGRPFRMWKFSTMPADASLRLAELLASDPVLRDEWERLGKLIRDPRVVSGVARFLRRTGLDELPQFYNILRGEMSLVGPRPLAQWEEDKYLQYRSRAFLEERHALPPGLTGYWQVRGRPIVQYPVRIDMDEHYLVHASFLLDIRIILETIPIVVFARGA